MRRLTTFRHDGVMLALLMGASATLLVAVAAGTWAWMSGRANAAVVDAVPTSAEITAEAGMRLRQVSVEGRERTRSSEILAALDLPQGAPLLALDPQAARERLESLPWVKEATVERRFPDLVHVRLVERTAIALLDRGDGDFVMVDADGAVIADDITPYTHLPVVSGAGAPGAAADLFTLLNSEPTLAANLTAAVRVGQRRWNLWFHGVGREGVEVRLPEGDVGKALARLARLEAEDAILQRDLRVIDMRLPDRLVVRLNDGSDEQTTKPGFSGRGVPLPMRGPARDA